MSTKRKHPKRQPTTRATLAALLSDAGPPIGPELLVWDGDEWYICTTKEENLDEEWCVTFVRDGVGYSEIWQTGTHWLKLPILK